MPRSIWKGPYFEKSVLKLTNNSNTWSRKSMILPQFIGKTLLVHNGKTFIAVRVQEQMVGHRLGEFALTRRSKPIKYSNR